VISTAILLLRPISLKSEKKVFFKKYIFRIFRSISFFSLNFYKKVKNRKWAVTATTAWNHSRKNGVNFSQKFQKWGQIHTTTWHQTPHACDRQQKLPNTS
jgi:hypothetical protein